MLLRLWCWEVDDGDVLVEAVAERGGGGGWGGIMMLLTMRKTLLCGCNNVLTMALWQC